MAEIESVREQDGSCCAHLTVKFQTKEENGLTQGWWECMGGCGVKFWPIGVSPDGEKINNIEKEFSDLRFLDSQEFYELMQVYRHSPVSDQGGTVKAFEAIKSWLCDQLSGFLDGETIKWLEAELGRVKRFGDAAADERDSLKVERDRLQGQLAELDQLFELQHKRTKEADRLWREATGRPDVLPDLGTLIQWLLDRTEQTVAAERERIMQLLRGPKDRGAFPVVTIRKEGEEEG